MSLSVATFNINSVRIRMPVLLDWLASVAPDVLCLQEIKCEEKDFPLSQFQEHPAGQDYDIFIVGQKSYNGVATLVKKNHAATVVANRLPGDPPAMTHSRFLEIAAGGIRIINIYAPNGNPVLGDDGKPSDKFLYKIDWLTALHDYITGLVQDEVPFVMVGDYNICAEDIDCYDPARMAGDALLHPQSRAAFRRLAGLGLVDLFRARHPDEPLCYTYWDYLGNGFQKNNGLRIDLALASPQLADRLRSVAIDQQPRHAEKPSDHTPLLCAFD